jgi:8-oxo-dGTP pyrophosphatase MutT (NUDIX family)
MSRGTARRAGGAQAIPRPADAIEYAHSPWRRLDHRPLGSLDAVCGAVAAAGLGGSDATGGPGGSDATGVPAGYRLSAVLVGLLEGPSGVEVVLTRRSQALTAHRGEIAFPGGRAEAGEGAREAALRESAEEVGLDPAAATVVGELSAMSTVVSASHVVPVVARLEAGCVLQPVSGEVERVLRVPLRELVRSDTYREELWRLGDRELRLHFFYLDDETVWGATARVLHQLIGVALRA